MSIPIGITSTLYERYDNPGVSDESDDLIEIFNSINQQMRATSSSLSLEIAVEQLVQTFINRLNNGWDGYDAEALSIGAFTDAKRFIELLPSNLPMPEIVPEPTGRIGLEWYLSKGNSLTVSLDGSGEISYAGILNIYDSIYGTWKFSGKLPPIFLDIIRRLLSQR